jgi:hypothetical protein
MEIYSPQKNRDERWRIRTDKIDLLLKHADIVRYIQALRIRWIGHSGRLDKERTVKRITGWIPITVMTGRPRLLEG